MRPRVATICLFLWVGLRVLCPVRGAAGAETDAEKPVNVALLRMELPRGFSEDERDALAQQFLQALQGTGRFVIVDRQDMEKIIEELKFQASDMVDQREVVELGGLMGVDFFVTCSIRPLRGIYQITARLISVEKANVDRIVVKRCEDRMEFASALFNDVAYDLARREDAKGTVLVETFPSGAEVRLFGVSQGRSPVRLRLAPGMYLLAVDRSGYQERRKTVFVEEGGETSWKPTLIKKSTMRLRDYIGGEGFFGREK